LGDAKEMNIKPMYIYLTNESALDLDVFFDELTITHIESPIIQEDHYYPFGLTMRGVGKQGSNPWKYNGKEAQDELDLGWIDYGARMLDPAIGRFIQIDPLASVMQEAWTSYHYVKNNPIKYIDPTGMIWEDQKEADKLKGNVEKRKAQLAKRKGKLQSKITKRSKKGKSTKNQEKSIATIDSRTDQMNQSISDIDALGADQNNTYRLASGDNQGSGKYGVTKGNDAVINIFGSDDGLRIHEIRHTSLSLASANGLAFDKNNNLLGTSPQTYGADDEVAGYQAQWGYTGNGAGAADSRWGVIENIANLKDDSGNYVYPEIRNKVYLRRQQGIRNAEQYQKKIKKGKTVKFKQ